MVRYHVMCIISIEYTHTGESMSLSRKNLMVEATDIRALADRLHTSESAAVRAAVRQMLAAEDILSRIDALRRRGTLGRSGSVRRPR